MLGTKVKVTAYQRQNKSALLDLAWYSHWTHKHIDWHTTGQWLDDQLGHVALAWHADQLVGYIGLSMPIDGWSWIRLLGIRDGRMPGLVVRELWEAVEASCWAKGISDVVLLRITNWLPTYLGEHGFTSEDDIISMSHIGVSLPTAPRAPVILRPSLPQDVEAIKRIDALSFEAPWQLTKDDIWQAHRTATTVTVAELNDTIVAYQMSTRQDKIGHLARLAVHPAHRRQGIASALLRRVVLDFRKQELNTLSVNTQLSNLASQRLYERFGFFRNGHDIELWRKRLS